MAIGGLSEKLKIARLLPHGKPLKFIQTLDRLVIHGLPEKCPDKINHVAVLEMIFARASGLLMGPGCELCHKPHHLDSRQTSPHVMNWPVSKLMPWKPLADVRSPRLSDRTLGWVRHKANAAGGGLPSGLLHTRQIHGEAPGVTFVGNRFRVFRSSTDSLFLGHDSGIRLWVDGREVFFDPKFVPPCIPGSSRVDVRLGDGLHEIVAALDNATAWGAWLCFGLPPKERRLQNPASWPSVVA